jgi:dolichol-phosphate mannosyltransferase
MGLISIVIPCFNECAIIERYAQALIAPLEALGVPFEIVAVDDGSTDGTRDALERLKPRAPLEVAAHARNLGLGAALRTGFSRARGEWVVALDADLTFSPSAIGALVRRQQESGADLVSGSPFLRGGGFEGVSSSRRLPSLIINSFYRALFRRDFTSYTPIFRLYRAARLKSLALTADGFEISVEIAVRFMQAGWTVAETPVVLTERVLGCSKMSALRELSRHAKLAARLFFSRRGA